MSTDQIFDILVIGGGINGCGIAADAAGRGLSVCLVEKGDLAGATSSASSKLIHGGLRYLEHFEFSLVRDALQERERLLKAAPHLISPLRFVLPHVDGMRPHWMLRAGLLLYDGLAKRDSIPGSRKIRFASDRSGPPLRPEITRGFSYWDCWVDDARLVVLNARSAARNGAQIETRTEVLSYQPDATSPRIWQIKVAEKSGVERTLRSRVLINAAGPWVDHVAAREERPRSQPKSTPSARKLRLVKGSHIVIPRAPGMPADAYLLQSLDKRVVFVLPFERDFTLIGTTDEPYDGDPEVVQCSDQETDYLLNVVNRFFVRRLKRSDVVHSFAGVRPLIDDAEDDPSKVSRDFRIELRADPGTPPLLSVLGGKITTYRLLAEAVVDRLVPVLKRDAGAWTANKPLPGGLLNGSFSEFVADMRTRFPWLESRLLEDLCARHGTLMSDVLGDATGYKDLGEQIAPGLCARETLYMRDNEWAETAEDVLWRRTKTGLHVPASKMEQVCSLIETVLAS